MEIDLTNLFLIVVVGFIAPLLLGFFPRVQIPAVVLEIALGIVVGPAVLGWVEIDDAVEVLALLGLAMLLFLAGLEIDFERMRGRIATLAAVGFIVSFAVALAVGQALSLAGFVDSGLFVAIVLSATSLGVVIPVLKDAERSESQMGQLVIAAASIADFVTIILLTLFFSGEASSTTSTLILLAGFFAASALLGLAIAGFTYLSRLGSVLSRLQDTTAQIRVRGAFALLVGLTALATNLGLELILGAFLAGAILKLVDHDRAMTHPAFRAKLEATGFGIFIPVFFVSSGVSFDLAALGDLETLVQAPVLLAALFLVRGIPSLLYGRLLNRREVIVTALLQATSLPFIVAATAIGTSLGAIDPGSAAAFVAAGLLSVVMFPALSLRLLAKPG